jgi:FkbM family methyltransferase
MQLSYAQNLEDYHLDLLFFDQPDGTYVDVGAGHPVADNVSFWFYLKGWRGLVVEPQPALAAIYEHVRPRDRVAQCLAGSIEGEADFYIVEKLHGFSSVVREHAAASGAFGAQFATVRVAVRRLVSLCEEAQLERIDFLKIDVEGSEADVLAGMDFARFRPRVVVVEAVAPGSMADAWAAWEPQLIDRHYRFAFFDGLNRFYVAEEEAALAGRFPPQPTPWHSVRHLYDYGRAPDRPDHPDHALARALLTAFFAELPALDQPFLERLLQRAAVEQADMARILFGTAEHPGPAPEHGPLAALMRTDRFRAALGRIACAYDGGHIME